MKKRILILIIIVFLLLAVSNVYAAIINAASGRTGDIHSAIGKAEPGDTVLIPEGTFNQDNRINIKKGITLMGSGMDKTVLRQVSGTGTLMMITCSESGKVRISSMTLVGNIPSSAEPWKGDFGYSSKLIYLRNDCRDIRIDHMHFERSGWAAIGAIGHVSGVIDHSIFDDVTTYAIEVFGDGDASWQRGHEAGSADAVFIEDNEFLRTKWEYISNGKGGNYVARYNEFKVPILPGGVIVESHGPVNHNPSDGQRAGRSIEVYNNHVDVSDSRSSSDLVSPFGLWGGEGLIFNNVVDGAGTAKRLITISRGKAGCDCTYPDCADSIQDSYIWNNTYYGNSNTQEHMSARGSVKCSNIVEGRDYFLFEKPGYTPYTYPHPLVEGGTKPQCSDGVDNDNDKLVDLQDPGCDNANDNDEFNEEVKENQGDINGDNEVNLLDILMIIKDFGKESGFDERADANGDKVINLLDILEVVKNWGKTF